MTAAEVSAVGSPAIYAPLPSGNGEQRLNALPVVDAGEDAGFDADLTPTFVAREVIGLLTGQGPAGPGWPNQPHASAMPMRRAESPRWRWTSPGSEFGPKARR